VTTAIGMTSRAYLAARKRSLNHVKYLQDDDAKL
jgi:hypothetical protein